MKKSSFALCLFICVTLVALIFLVGCKNDPEPQIDPEDNNIAGSLCMQLVEGIASGAGGKIGDLVMGNILSAFGFADPESGLSGKMDDIQNQVQSISAKIDEVESQINSLRNYMDSVEKTTLAEIDRSEFDTRMTVLNQYFAQIETLYGKYLRIAKADDYATADALADQLIADIEKADLPTTLQFMRTEFNGGGAGAQRSLIGIYQEYLSKATTWTYQMMDALNYFAEYCETEMFRAGELYLEYCTYKQAQYAGDEGQYNAWGSNSQEAKTNVTVAIEEADRKKLDVNYYGFNYGSVYHFANLAYGFDFYLDTSPVYLDDYTTSPYDHYSTVPFEQFENMGKLSAACGYADLLSFIADQTKVNLRDIYVAGCIPTDNSAPLISLKTLSQKENWGSVQQFFKTWVAGKPVK